MRLLAVVVLVLGVQTWAQAQETPQDRPVLLRLAAGAMVPSTVYIEETGFDTNMGPIVGLMLEKLVSDGVSGGSFVYVVKVGGEADVSTTLATVGGHFKLHFGSPETVDFRMGVGLGLNLGSVSGGSGFKGFNAMPIAELFFPAQAWRLGIQVIGISQPAGGNEDVFISFYPIPSVMLGLERAL